MTEPHRHTDDWEAWELDILEFYALLGGPWVRRELAKRGRHRSAYSIRHHASRLKLPERLTDEYVYASEITAEAGTTPQAIHAWLRARGWRKHCRMMGGRLLVPELIARYYLHEQRVSERPRGYWGSARAADYLGVDPATVPHYVQPVQHGRTRYYNPDDLEDARRQMQARQPPANYVPLRPLTGPGTPYQQAKAWLKAHGTPAQQYGLGKRRAPLWVHEDAARQFLSARGHHDEMVETLIRKAVLIGMAKSQK